jgi:hypothetical protein
VTLGQVFFEYFGFPCQIAFHRLHHKPITVATRSKALTTFARWNAGIVGSNPTRGMDVCVRLSCVSAVLCVGSGLATGSSSVQGVLLSVYGIKKLEKAANKGL